MRQYEVDPISKIWSRSRLLALLVGFLVLVIGCDSSSDSSEREWQLVWQDEFDGSAGQLPDPTRWAFDVGTDWGNAQLEYDTDRPENASLDGQGNLVITARRETFQGQPYTSARILTRGLFEQTYGRFEARMQLPSGAGMWPAFWLLGANYETVGWPACGEIDIMEYRGQEPNIVIGSLHGPGYSGGGSRSDRFVMSGEGFNEDFHVFAVEWTDGAIIWEVDGIPYHTVTPRDVPRWVFNQPFFIIVNVAVGGNFVGPPNESTQFPQTMLIDYIRVSGVSP